MREPLTQLESDLARLPEPPPPAGLAEAVMARVARVDAARADRVRIEAAGEAARERWRRPEGAGVEDAVRGRGRLAAALGASGAAAYVYGLASGAWAFDPLASPMGEGITTLVSTPASVSAALGLTAALLLYLAGLLAPLGRDPVSRSTAPPRAAGR